MPVSGNAAARTALPQPPNTSQKVPSDSAARRLVSGIILFLPHYALMWLSSPALWSRDRPAPRQDGDARMIMSGSRRRPSDSPDILFHADGSRATSMLTVAELRVLAAWSTGS